MAKRKKRKGRKAGKSNQMPLDFLEQNQARLAKVITSRRKKEG